MKNEEKKKEKSITVKKENKRVIPNTVSNVYQSPTARTVEKPFSNKNINHKW